MRPCGRRRGGRTAGRRSRTRFRKAAMKGCKGPAARRITRQAPSRRLLLGPGCDRDTLTDPGRQRSPRFGSGCLATRKPRKPSPANPGSNALQKGRASVCPDLTSPLTGSSDRPVPAGAGKPDPPPPGSKGSLKTNLVNPNDEKPPNATTFSGPHQPGGRCGVQRLAKNLGRTPGRPPSEARAASAADPTR